MRFSLFYSKKGSTTILTERTGSSNRFLHHFRNLYTILTVVVLVVVMVVVVLICECIVNKAKTVTRFYVCAYVYVRV